MAGKTEQEYGLGGGNRYDVIEVVPIGKLEEGDHLRVGGGEFINLYNDDQKALIRPVDPNVDGVFEPQFIAIPKVNRVTVEEIP